MSHHVSTQLPDQPGILQPAWLRVPDAVRYSGFSRSKIYELTKAGKIRSASIREPGQTKGTRLIDRQSLLAFIDSQATGGETL